MSNKIITNKFKWVPMDKRGDRFGPLPPRKPDTRVPLLWLVYDKGELFLVNSTNECIETVKSLTVFFIPMDDDPPLLVRSDDYNYCYENVQPEDAVKIEEYDEYFELHLRSDSYFSFSLEVKSEKLGRLEISTPTSYREIYELVLLWDNGEAGNYVRIRNLSNA